MKPLFSILMPSYNAAATLPRALCSLIHQSCSDWECVLVDDASHDDTKKIVDQIGDKRIRYFRLEDNAGRGAARQKALELAQGEIIGMLDADDWIYPDRLGDMARVFEQNPQIDVVATGMVVVSPENRNPQLVPMTQGKGPELHPALTRPQALPIPYAPTFLRSEVARSTSFNPRLKASEDFDYLLRILMRSPYLVLPQMDYVYIQPVTIPVESLLMRLRFNHQIYAQYFTRFPVTTARAWLVTWVKALAYQGLYQLGVDYQTVRKRAPITVADFDLFNRARTSLEKTLQRFFPGETDFRASGTKGK